MIKQEGGKWCLYTKDGSRKLGEHDTEAQAQAQERAIEASKHRAAACNEMRDLHLRNAFGAVRTEIYNDREHLVVPVIALMDGVIHAVNASAPERVTAETLAKAAASWNGRPLVLGHPKKNGKQCSANDPEVEARHRFGTIFNSRMVGPKLSMDAYVDPVCAERVANGLGLDGAEFVRKLRDGEQIEVSVGAYVQTNGATGVYNGRAYQGEWLDTYGDHLAFLPGGRGACSIEMGCGAHRAAEVYLVTAEGFELETLEVKDCPVCDGTGQVKTDDKQADCTACGGTGQLRVAEMLKTLLGARNSSKDMAMIQAIHDHTATLGAMCSNQRLMEEQKQKRIRHEGGTWVLYSRDLTRKLGSHDTEAEAFARMTAVEERVGNGGSGAATGKAAGCGCNKAS